MNLTFNLGYLLAASDGAAGAEDVVVAVEVETKENLSTVRRRFVRHKVLDARLHPVDGTVWSRPDRSPTKFIL